jgi:hypothetical protein
MPYGLLFFSAPGTAILTGLSLIPPWFAGLRFLRSRFANYDNTIYQKRPIQGGDRLFRLTLGRHFHECATLELARIRIDYQVDRGNRSCHGKELPDIIFRGPIGDMPHIKLFAHGFSSFFF